MHLRHDQVAMIALYTMPVAIMYSKALITLCYIIMAMAAIYRRIKYRSYVWNNGLGAMSLIGIAFLISGINSSNIDQWIHHCVIKLPFIIAPLTFMVLPRWSAHQILRIHLILLLVLLISIIPVLGDIFFNYHDFLDRLSVGQTVDSPIEHVKYSMFLSYGVVSGFIWITFYRDRLSRGIMWFVTFSIIFLFVISHLMAIRTGLVISYASLIICAVYFLLRAEMGIMKKVSMMLFALICMAPLIMTPMIQAKVAYMLYDWHMYVDNGGELYSDSERLFSIQVGLELWGQNLMLGTGIGDLLDMCTNIYMAQDRGGPVNYPHAQFFYLLAGTGLIGTLLFMVGFLYPLRVSQINGNKLYLLLSAIYLNYSISFLVENSMERSISIAFFLTIALPLINSKSET